MRLLDKLSQRGLDTYPFAGMTNVLASAFASPDNEKISASYLNAAAAYTENPVVFGVILARLSLFSEAEFKFQNKATKKLYGSPALAKLEHPWPGGTTAELLVRMEQDVSLAGNAYVRDLCGTAEAMFTKANVERLRPDWVTIVSQITWDDRTDSEVREVIGYLYEPTGLEKREPAFYPVHEVAHWSPIPDPLATYKGMSWLTPVMREIDADQGMTDYKRAYLENAATPNLLILYKQKVGQAKINVLRDQIEARHGGAGNAFRTLVLDEGADTTIVGHSLKDMNFDTVQAAGENRIAVAGGTPAIVVGLKEGLQAATYSNYGLAMRRFADLWARPQWRSACSALAKLIEIPDDSRLWYDVAGIAALREGEKELAEIMSQKAAAAQQLISSGYTPESIIDALAASDLTLLKHSGLISVQLQAPGTPPPEPVAPPAPAPELDPKPDDEDPT